MLAGNVDAVEEVVAAFDTAGVPYVVAPNVVPRIGALAPDGARAAIREMFLSHVIGGKHLSARTDFTAMVRGATPDVVLTAVELAAAGLGPEQPGAGDVVVVDVGERRPTCTRSSRSTRRSRVSPARWWRPCRSAGPSRATSVCAGAQSRRSRPLVKPASTSAPTWSRLPNVVASTPASCPPTRSETEHDLAIASAAVHLAVRRHAGRQQVVFSPEGRLVERSGKDLREVDLLIGSGGVLRHNARADALRVIAAGTGDHVEGGWLVPRDPQVVIDHDYVLAAAGLLAADHPEAAYRLLTRLWEPPAG